MRFKKTRFKRNSITLKQEGLAKLYLYKDDSASIPSKSMKVFYNEKMEINRDISLLAIKAYNNIINRESLEIVDCMAASGVTSLRLLKNSVNIEKIYINDINPTAVKLIDKNLELNGIASNRIALSNKDASLLFIEISQKNRLPDVISIDPFGTPNIYVDSAFKAIKKHDGLLCITATDTAVLFGVRPKACVRKYMSKPIHSEYCKEVGARILLYFISRIANINNTGITPLLTFYSNHFIRVFVLTYKGKTRIQKNSLNSYGYLIHCKKCGHRIIISEYRLGNPHVCPLCLNNDYLYYSGPLWIKEIHQKLFLDEITRLNEQLAIKNKKRIDKLINFALQEINMPISYYNIHKLCQQLKLSYIPKLDKLINRIKENGYRASRTHFDFISIKTNMRIDDLKSLLSQIEK
ncbi:MAG: tRNA (guanine(10)-N(2))-dimethyltransferase [Candidatus Lokiarchaeota archaeon]|nr:tRNA (guanine(10)-N(2))-dimethyltransferase [Candidatus Lokiarchaeota archaeon]